MANAKPLQKQWIIASLLGIIAMSTGLWLGFGGLQQISGPLEIAGIYLDEPKAVGDFTLTASSNQPFTLTSFEGQWSFLYFGYTYCPDACPLTLGQLNVVDKNLAEQNLNKDNAYILISVDPNRDTPERLAEYTRFFNENFSGATGTPEQLDQLTKPLGVYYSVPEDPEDPENYLVDHSSAIVLINPKAELQALFTPPHDPKRITEDFSAIRQRFEAAN